jgi:hypothetical protein
MNDLADRINSLNCGVPFDDFCLSLLLYADDIALIAPDENSLQRMLDVLNVHPSRHKDIYTIHNNLEYFQSIEK